MSEVKHVLGISGGKDSAALAIYLNDTYTKEELPIEYYTCDTGRELDETYVLIEQLRNELQSDIKTYVAIDHESTGSKTPFDYFLSRYRGFLPSPNARWCTKNLKLAPFEKEIGDTPTISYVGIRGDENREGYISTKSNIQSIFPFRKNIWSKDVINKAFKPENKELLKSYYLNVPFLNDFDKVQLLLDTPISKKNSTKVLVDNLLNVDIRAFNHVIFQFLKTTDYPVGKLDYFPLIDNTDIIVRKDVFEIIEDSTVDLPNYYRPIEYEVDGEKGKYFRSRSGCFFCFYQQKIEWVWLKEQHPKLFEQAMEYEKDGFSWMEDIRLEDFTEERINAIKREHLKGLKRKYNTNNQFDWKNQIIGVDRSIENNEAWLDEITDAEQDGCASCFI